MAKICKMQEKTKYFIKRMSFTERKYEFKINVKAKKLIERLNNLPKKIDSGNTLPVKIFNIRTGLRLYKRPAKMHRPIAYERERLNVETVSIFFALRWLVFGNITMLMAPGKNKKTLPTTWAKEYTPASSILKKYFTNTISKLTRDMKQNVLIPTGNK